MDEKPFFHFESQADDGTTWGVKGLGDGIHLTHQVGSDEFHITMPIKIGPQETLKIRDYFDSQGGYKDFNFDITDKE